MLEASRARAAPQGRVRSTSSSTWLLDATAVRAMSDATRTRTRVLGAISEVRRIFPASLIDALRFRRVDDANLDELLARASGTFAPVFLPIFTREGDDPLSSRSRVARCALGPTSARRRGAALLASSIKALPKSLVAIPITHDAERETVWEPATELARAIGDAPSPSRSEFDPPGNWVDQRAKADPADFAPRAVLAGMVVAKRSAKRSALEALARTAPEDTNALALLALVLGETNRPEGAAIAAEVLRREVPLGFPIGADRYLERASSGPALLESLRALAMEAIAADAPLERMRDTTYVESRAVDTLLGVAATLQAQGDNAGTLNQTRNAAYVAGAHGAGVTRALCATLADAAERVEPGGVSAALASLAAHVHGKGA